MKKPILSALFLLCTIAGFSQAKKWNPYARHRIYFFWGWNRAAYTKSDLSIKGDDYQLVLKKIVAHDRQTPFSYHNYLQIDHMTIPQNNWRIGYFIKDGLAISFGTDHMKYVMDQNQIADVVGTITREGPFKGTYNGPTRLTEDFITFEHTDGLNYVNVELEKYHVVSESPDGNWILGCLLAGGAGMLYPKTNAKILDYERNDQFHVSGFGLDLKAGLEAIVFKHFALRFEAKGGYINMPNIVLHKKGINGKGNQDFMFAQCNGSLMFNFGFSKHRVSQKTE